MSKPVRDRSDQEAAIQHEACSGPEPVQVPTVGPADPAKQAEAPAEQPVRDVEQNAKAPQEEPAGRAGETAAADTNQPGQKTSAQTGSRALAKADQRLMVRRGKSELSLSQNKTLALMVRVLL